MRDETALGMRVVLVPSCSNPNFWKLEGEMNQKPKTFEESLDLYLGKMRELMIKKQKDYGPRNILDCGEIGLVVRLNDKLARIKNLYGVTNGSFQKKSTCNESIDDTFVDIANYGLIGMMLRGGDFDLPLQGD